MNDEEIARAMRETLTPEQIGHLLDTVRRASQDPRSASVANSTRAEINLQMWEVLGAVEPFFSDVSSRTAVYEKLVDTYRYVDDFSGLGVGRYVRFLRFEGDGGSPSLSAGGIVLRICPTENGNVNITCKGTRGYIFQYDFNKMLTFQKLTKDELIFLYAKEQVPNY